MKKDKKKFRVGDIVEFRTIQGFGDPDIILSGRYVGNSEYGSDMCVINFYDAHNRELRKTVVDMGFLGHFFPTQYMETWVLEPKNRDINVLRTMVHKLGRKGK